MILLETSFDTVLKADYELYSVKLSELKQLALSWYEGIDLKAFDGRHLFARDLQNETRQMKLSGVVCNFFFAYKENSKFYLMDGFNRLFTDYGDIGSDPTVYIKVIVSELKDHDLMLTMYRLNMWKLSTSGHTSNGFSIQDYFDRGFRLFLYSKFGIILYEMPTGGEEYHTRRRSKSDVNIIDHYFRRESEISDSYKTSYSGVRILMGNENIINDLKALIDGNDYLEKPFNNYGMFLRGFAMYLGYLRYEGNNKPYRFEYFLDKLYADKSFFKKLQGMSGTDSTRKNIFHFYRGLKLENN
jgi:hypothetical protein